MKELILVVLGVAITVIAALAAKLFIKTPSAPPVQAGPTKKTQEAIDTITQVVIGKAKVGAKTDAERARLDDIMNVPEPDERLTQLAEELKKL